MAYGNILFPFIFQYLNKLKTHIQKILAGCHFCLLTHLAREKLSMLSTVMREPDFPACTGICSKMLCCEPRQVFYSQLVLLS